MAMVITSENNRGTMEWKRAVVVTILFISAVSMAGCTGTSPAPVVTPGPVPVPATAVSTAAPVTTAAVVAPATTRPTLETPVTGNPSSKTYSFEGTGDDTRQFTTPDDRTWVFRMSSPAKEIFLVKLMDSHGDDIDVLADASDVYAGTESVSLKAGTWYLDVSADSPWTITMSTA
jgi:hypothetical protein